MGGLAHYFESAGLPTTQISLIRLHTEKMRPPRALWVPFELGRPFGAPGDSELQYRVVAKALSLLDSRRGPLLVDFAEEAPTTSTVDHQPWVCPVQLKAPPQSDDSHALINGLRDEIAGLAPWYARSVQARARTTMGVSGLSIAEISQLLSGLLDEISASKTPPSGITADDVRHAAEDLKAYYFEAVAAQPGTVTSEELQQWFWRDTAAGSMLRLLKTQLRDSPDASFQLLSNLLLVPQSQS
ncbi:MAG: hypothetical protein AB7N70_15770 [Dehalococcoidia bacterium]